MLNFLLSNLKANFCIFLIIFNSMTLLLILIPPIQKTLTYLHELGHCMHLYYAYKKLNIKHQKSVIMPLQRTKGIFYKSQTQNDLYIYFENNKQDNKIKKVIKSNAIAGSLFVILINIIIIIISIILHNYIIALFIGNIFIEILNFITSSDYKHFKHPEEYTYNE